MSRSQNPVAHLSGQLRQRCSSIPNRRTPRRVPVWASIIGWPISRTAFIAVRHPTPKPRAAAATGIPSWPTWRTASRRALSDNTDLYWRGGCLVDTPSRLEVEMSLSFHARLGCYQSWAVWLSP